MKSYKMTFAFILIFIVFSLSASSKNDVPMYKLIQQTIADARKAETEQNAPLAAKAYAKAIMLTRKQPAEKQKDLAMLLFSYGLMLTYAGDYEDAVAPLDEAVKRSRSSGDKGTEARCLTQMGIINFFLNNWDRALVYYQQAEVIAKEIGNKQGLSIIINNISNIYQKKHNYRRAIKGYMQTLMMQRELHDSATICNTLFNIGTCHEELQNEKDAEAYLNQAYKIASAIKDVEIYSLSAAHIARHLMKKGEKAAANKLFDDAERMTLESEYKAVRTEVYQVRSSALEEAGDYHAALTYYKKMKLLNDSLQKEDAQRQINELQIKNKTIENKHRMEEQQEELHQKDIMQIVLAIGIAACLIILFIVNRYRVLVRKRNRGLREMNNMKDKFFSVISHDLKNPVLAQRNSLAAIVDNFGKASTEDIHALCIELLDSSKSLLDLLYNLLSWSRLQSHRISYNPATFPLIDLMRNVEKLVGMQLNAKSLTLNVNIPADATVTADRNMISTVLRNLVGNAIKFSHKGGTIELCTKKEGQLWNVCVTNHGIGMSAEVQESLFKIESQKLSAGTNGETGSGLGLVVCKEIMDLHGGHISVKSQEGQGSTFCFTLQEG